MIINESNLKERLKLEKKLQELKQENERKRQEAINDEFNLAIKTLNTCVNDARDVIDTVKEILECSKEFYIENVEKILREKFPNFGFDTRGNCNSFYLLPRDLKHPTAYSPFPILYTYYFYPDLETSNGMIGLNIYYTHKDGVYDMCSDNIHYQHQIDTVNEFTKQLKNYIKEFTKIINNL